MITSGRPARYSWISVVAPMRWQRTAGPSAEHRGHGGGGCVRAAELPQVEKQLAVPLVGEGAQPLVQAVSGEGAERPADRDPHLRFGLGQHPHPQDRDLHWFPRLAAGGAVAQSRTQRTPCLLPAGRASVSVGVPRLPEASPSSSQHALARTGAGKARLKLSSPTGPVFAMLLVDG
jgi:hypothetical protein